jgi:hypothetical protein
MNWQVNWPVVIVLAVLMLGLIVQMVWEYLTVP